MAADVSTALTELRGTSTEKVLAFTAYLQELRDDQLAEALPVASPMVVRMALVAFAARVPDDPADLDGHLERVAALCLSLKSDE